MPPFSPLPAWSTPAWAAASGGGDSGDASGLIAREALFGNPDKAQARLSPDGARLSFIAPVDGVLNVWVGPVGDIAAARPITKDDKRGIQMHFWAYDNRHVLFVQDQDGDENWRLYAVDLEAGAQRDLTPIEGVTARVAGLSWRRPGFALIGINDRTPEWHDLYEIEIATGERRLIELNDQDFAYYEVDDDLKPRLAVKTTPEGNDVLRRVGEEWVEFFHYGREDSYTTHPIAIEGGGDTALMFSSLGRDKAALMRLDLASGEQREIAASDRADIRSVWLEPKTARPQAYGITYLKPEITPLDEAAAEDIAFLTATLGDAFEIVSRTLEDDRWILVTDAPQVPAVSHLYDRRAKTLTKLFEMRPSLAGAPLAPMEAIEIEARDGLKLVSYLTRPLGAEGPTPMALVVHGGPWARDHYGFNPAHQWLANRGYAVLSVNFRGSTGFGKGFINAGDNEWAGKMHDDLLDAVDWAVKQGVAERDKVAIYGGSYGGYATLVGLTFTPDVFACGVDIVGPSNLNTLLATIPPYWKAAFEELAARVGDPRTEEGRKQLTERSPLTRVEAITKPLLIFQGANDPRVKKAEADQIAEAMKAKGLPVTYILYPDEGHGFVRPQNRKSCNAITEAFLAHCLGGRFEPIGDDFQGATLEVIDGAEHAPGLEAALNARE